MTAPTRVPRLPFVLLALMTTATFGGPVAFGLILRGGARSDWPPDRPVEWAALAVISGLVVALMVVCVMISVTNQRDMARRKAAAKSPEFEAKRTGAPT